MRIIRMLKDSGDRKAGEIYEVSNNEAVYLEQDKIAEIVTTQKAEKPIKPVYTVHHRSTKVMVAGRKKTYMTK